MRKITTKQVHEASKSVSRYRDLVNQWLKSLEADELEAVMRILRENKQTRESLKFGNKYGVNKSGSFRMGMSVPYGLLRFLEFAEPEIWQNTGTGKKARARLFKECPELTTAESR